MVLISPNGAEVSYSIKFKFKATNNQAEYETFITGLKLALALRAEKVKVRTYSQLVTDYLNESFQMKDKKMEQYLKCSK